MQAKTVDVPRLRVPGREPRVLLSAALALALFATGTAEARTKTRADTGAGGTYMGYTGSRWAEDFGVTRGRCDSKAMAAALASADGTADGAATRTALLSGTELRDVHRACAAHALELARNHRTVRWSEGARTYALSTGGDTVMNGLPCRPFILVQAGKRTLGTACQSQPGLWEVQSR